MVQVMPQFDEKATEPCILRPFCDEQIYRITTVTASQISNSTTANQHSQHFKLTRIMYSIKRHEIIYLGMSINI